MTTLKWKMTNGNCALAQLRSALLLKLHLSLQELIHTCPKVFKHESGIHERFADARLLLFSTGETLHQTMRILGMLLFEARAFFVFSQMNDPKCHRILIKVIMCAQPVMNHPSPFGGRALNSKTETSDSFIEGAAQKMAERVHRTES